MLSILEEKRPQAVNSLELFLSKRKATIKEMEKLAGYLNFLRRAIYPGRAFTRRMYAKFKTTVENKELKSYHHVKLDEGFKKYCSTWLSFLKESEINPSVCRPWVDWDIDNNSIILDF